uniref:Collectin-12 n=1 Tax=Magallana gigas TaxID=29159 RepID=K1QMT6_MAGGI
MKTSKANEEGYMAGLYLIQVTILICLIACVDGQALYEDICVNKIVNEMHQFYDREMQLQTQVNKLKDQLGSCTCRAACLALETVHTKGMLFCIKLTETQKHHMRVLKTKCQSFGGHLLEIETQSEQIWLKGKVSFLAERWWIGAALDTVKNVWIWDYSGTAMSFTNWHPVEPNGEGREQCALMWDADLWQDYPCTDLFYIICERN